MIREFGRYQGEATLRYASVSQPSGYTRHGPRLESRSFAHIHKEII